MIPIMGKLRPTLLNYLAQSPIDNKWYSLHLNLITLVPEPLLVPCLSLLHCGMEYVEIVY